VEFLSDAELGAAREAAKRIKVWISAVDDEVYRRLTAGGNVPGAKLVEGRSVRQFKDGAEDAAKARFGEAAFTTPELKSPAQIDKLPGGRSFSAEWAFSPPGKPTVVDAADSRPAVRTVPFIDELMAARD
jgi:hypothetical protein